MASRDTTMGNTADIVLWIQINTWFKLILQQNMSTKQTLILTSTVKHPTFENLPQKIFKTTNFDRFHCHRLSSHQSRQKDSYY